MATVNEYLLVEGTDRLLLAVDDGSVLVLEYGTGRDAVDRIDPALGLEHVDDGLELVGVGPGAPIRRGSAAVGLVALSGADQATRPGGARERRSTASGVEIRAASTARPLMVASAAEWIEGPATGLELVAVGPADRLVAAGVSDGP